MAEDMEDAFNSHDEHDDVDVHPDEFNRPLGGADPVDAVRTPRKRAGLALVVGVIVVCLGGLWWFVHGSKSAKNDGKDTAVAKTATVALAGVDTSKSAGSLAIDTTVSTAGAAAIPVDSAVLLASKAKADSIRSAAPLTGAQMPTGLPTGGLGGSMAPGAPVGGGGGYMGGLVDSGSSMAPGAAGGMAATREAKRQETLARRVVADSLRKIRVAAEEARLRQSKTAIIEGDAPTSGGGNNRFTGAGGKPDTEMQPQADASTGAGAGIGAGGAGGTSIGGVEVPPGTSVKAVMESEFVSSGNGDGSSLVKARLAQALVVGGKVLLPVNTVAYGQASASGGDVTDAFVKVAFSTFVTPNRQVIRGVTAVAGDPKTFSGAVSGSVDQHLAGRVTRGLLATVVDIALSANSQRLSAFQQPSTRDVAVLKAQDRFSSIIEGNVGDENSKKPTVVLKAGTPISILFGLSN